MRKLLTLVTLASTLAGCGTTVPQGARGAHQQFGGGDGSLAPKGKSPTSGDGGFTEPGTGTPNNFATSGATADPAGTTGPAGPVPTSTATVSPGAVANQPVKVGFVVAANNTDAAFDAVGMGALKVGNQRAQAQVVVNDINAHGGLAGRRIEPVFHEPDSASASYDDADTGACTFFTQDARVAFVISTLAHQAVLHSCLAKAGVPLLDNNLYLYDSKFVTPGLLFMPSSWLLDRLMRNEIDALARMGFFNDPGKVGVLLYDLPIPKRVLQDTVLPRLAHYGKTQVDVAFSTFDTAGAANQQGNVLKFSNDGVTRVINIAFSPIGFMQHAEAQQYHPRYGLDSSVGPETIRTALKGASGQLKGMVGVGWIPSSDTGSAKAVTPTGQRCLTLMKRAGENTDNSTTASLMEQFCDAGWFLQAATNAARDASGPGLVRGARLTKGYVSASSFGADMTSGRSDGLSRYRDFAYQEGCSCIQYVGEVRTAS